MFRDRQTNRAKHRQRNQNDITRDQKFEQRAEIVLKQFVQHAAAHGFDFPFPVEIGRGNRAAPRKLGLIMSFVGIVGSGLLRSGRY